MHSLDGNEIITDIGISNLVNLTSLNLSSNSTISNEGIKNLINLKTLELVHNSNITEISHLVNLTGIMMMKVFKDL
jgi:Leucine-rich repeat (LRR) protein